MTDTALLPCPFCGEHLRPYSEQGGYFHPLVSDCPLCDWEMLADGYSEERWNTRTGQLVERAGVVEAIRLFPEAHDVLTAQEMRDAKGNWRSLIDQQTNALASLRAALRARAAK